MRITRKEYNAILKSADKYDSIIMGHDDIAMATIRCELCHVFMDDDAKPRNCNACPLYKSGNGCLEKYSTWYQIFSITESHKEIDWDKTVFDWRFAEKNIVLFHELFVLCNRIRHYLLELLKCEIEDDVQKETGAI